MIANNSGGMRCGVVHDAYQTLRAMKLVLPSGTVIDTEAPDAEERFAAAEPELARGLLEIRDEIRADDELTERIRRKFRIKNTMGYRLCAFLDADTPLEIFRRLVVGSEGTLAFVAEAVFETVPHPRGSTRGDADLPRHRHGRRVGARRWSRRGATAVELMLTLTLKAASSFVTIPQEWEDAPWETAAILVEFRSDDPAELAERQAAAEKILADHPLVQPCKFSTDPEVTELYWRVREGMHGLVGRMRPPHTALIVEDVCVAPERIAECAKDVRELLGEHGFLPGVAGHASAGNLHFMLTPEFAQESERERYEGFMEALVDLIVDKYDGSLKAEHGTGVNMAPFVEREWGAKATELMRRVKRLADPDGVLAPGVILNDDPGMPPAEPEDDAVDRGRRRRRPVRRVRLLRARLPEPRPDHDAAPADRPAARDGAPAGGLAGARRPARRVRVRRHPDLRGRRHVRARLPARDRHRRAGEEVPRRRSTRRARSGPGSRPRSAGRRSSARRAPGSRARPVSKALSARRPGGPERRARPRLARRDAAAGAVDPAGDAPRGRGRGLPARVHQPDLRPEPARGAGPGLGARRAAALDPRRRRRALLRGPVELEGPDRGRRLDGRPHRRGGQALGGRRTACRS